MAGEDVSPAVLIPFVYAYLIQTNMVKAAKRLKKEASALVVRHASLFIIWSAMLLCIYIGLVLSWGSCRGQLICHFVMPGWGGGGGGGGGGANGYLYVVYAVILQIRYPPYTLQITGQIVIHTCFELSNAAFLQVQMVLYL